jgi:2-iminoacetate synthase
MELSRPGLIKRFCTPNALVTLAEYLTDYATEETRRDGVALIEHEIAGLESEETRNRVRERLARIRTGDERDLCF